ncbi:importin beta, partial [Trifolium medium]|nr:importin beta [Trifolium medium]
MNVVQNREFWLNRGNFDLVFGNIVELIYSMDQELKNLAYNASMSLMLLSNDLQRTEICDFLLPILLNMIDQQGEEEVLVNRVKRLWDLATMDDGNIFKWKYGEVFWCMIPAAEVEDASEELRFAAVNVIMELDGLNLNAMESLIENLSCEEVRRVVAVAMNMLSCVVDDPLWYDVDYQYCMNAGMTDAFNLGVCLFNALTLDGNEHFRYAAMLAIGWIAQRNIRGEMMQYFDQVVTLVLKSLDDPDPR